MQFLTFFILCAVSTPVLNEPLTLPDSKPMVSIYYFTHWWEPWKSDDNAVLDDFNSLHALGFSCNCLTLL